MFSKIGTGELILILIIALFVIGPNKLPGVAKAFGKAMGSARKYLNDITEEVKDELKDVDGDLKDIKAELQDAGRSLKNALADEPAKPKPGTKALAEEATPAEPDPAAEPVTAAEATPVAEPAPISEEAAAENISAETAPAV